MIKAIIFDYGGVMTDGGTGNESAQRLAKFLDIDVEHADHLEHEAWPELMKGTINEDQYWQILEKSFGAAIPQASRQIWNTWADMSPRAAILDLVHELKATGYTVGLLSNVMPHTESLIREHNGYELFNPCILSCTLGYAKPDVRMYQEVLDHLPYLKPEEIVFIDDKDAFLIPAKELGMQTIHALTENQIITDIRRLLKAEPS